MLTNSLSADQESVTLTGAARIRAAIAEEHEALLRSIAVLVARMDRRLPWPEVMDTAAEILHEAVQQSLQHALAFDTSRSAGAWIRGIAARLLLSRRRADARGRRCVAATVLGKANWAAALDQLRAGSTDAAVAGRLDLEAALACISPDERHAIECRYYQGLEGTHLARALGVATPGAARVRVCRALQALRTHFPVGAEEVLP
jgi:DNA-directed RNA polymerase specialized sigma24 family protein